MSEKRPISGPIVGKSEMNLWTQVPTQVQIMESQYDTIKAVNLSPLDLRQPIEFSIQGYDEWLIDPMMILHLQVLIQKPDGKALDPAVPVAPINGYLSSLFKSSEVTIGSTPMPSSQGSMPYVSYLYNLLTYSQTAQNGLLRRGLWFRDTAGAFNDVTADPKTANTNDGFNQRQSWVMSNYCDLAGPLNIDLCKTSRLLLHKLNINIKLFRSSPQFLLMTNEADNTKSFQVSINSAELLVRRIRPRCADLMKIEHELSGHYARYPYVQNTMFTYTVPTRSQNIETIVWSGVLPRRSTMLMVSQTSFNGSYKDNPYNFRHYDIQRVCLEVNGRTIPKTPQTLSWNAPIANALPYIDLFLNSCGDLETTDIAINLADFQGGYALFPFALTPDMDTCGLHKSSPEVGVVTLKAQLSTPNTDPFIIIFIHEFEREIVIDRDRNVTVE